MKTTTIKARLILSAGSFVIALCCLDLGAQLYSRARYGAQHVDLKISERMHYLAPASGDRMNAARSWEDTLRLHPLFGYVLSTKLPGVNNYGFMCDQDITISTNGYAFKRGDRAKTIILGVFGGSFAHITTCQTKEYLATELARIFPGRTPIVVNFAQGGYALPQTFFSFSYFRSLVDIVVFIDGLNEPWNCYLNNVCGSPPEYAKTSIWNYKLSVNELTPFTFNATVKILEKRRQVQNITAFSLLPIVKRSMLVHYLWQFVCRRAENSAAAITQAIEKSYAMSAGKVHDVPDEIVFRFSANQWRGYHESVHSLSVQDGLLDLHVLQPNPFAPGRSKCLVENEARLLSEDCGTKFIVTNAYPLISAELVQLKQRGITCLDLGDFFHSQTNKIWIDYCHANKYGCTLVARQIVNAIEEKSNNWKPPYPVSVGRLQKE